MMKNACEECKRYYPDEGILSYCPVCGRDVKSLQDDKTFVASVWDRAENRVYDKETDTLMKKHIVKKQAEPSKTYNESSVSTSPVYRAPMQEVVPSAKSAAGNVYTGCIDEYTPVDNARLSFFEKAQLFFRGMHYGYTVHRITFTDESTARQYIVTFYGELQATSSAVPARGFRITVYDKPEGNYFNTENVYIGEGGGSKVRLRNQHSNSHSGSGKGVVSVLIIMAVILACCMIVGFVSSGGLSIVANFIKLFLAVTIVCFVAIMMLSRRRNIRGSFTASIVLGVIGTIVLYNIGDIRTLLQEFLGGLIVPLITIVGIILIIRSVINPR